MNLSEMAEKITEREKARKNEVNITQVRTVLRHYFDELIEQDNKQKKRFGDLPRSSPIKASTLFHNTSMRYYERKDRERKKKS